MRAVFKRQAIRGRCVASVRGARSARPSQCRDWELGAGVGALAASGGGAGGSGGGGERARWGGRGSKTDRERV